MTSSTQQSDGPEPEENNSEEEYWTAKAWVYFIWVVMGTHVYCKVGYSKNPGSRVGQIIRGIPERPYYVHMLPCLSVEQARLFESMFHFHLHPFKSKTMGSGLPIQMLSSCITQLVIKWMRYFPFFIPLIMRLS